jgi:hypothetical protein
LARHMVIERLNQGAKVFPDFEALVLRRCVTAEAAVDPETGEEVPGVTITIDPGGEGKYVAARQSEAQFDALVAAYQAGDVDLIELATVPPQIEAGA